MRTTTGLAPTSSEMLDDGNALGGNLPQPGTGVPTNPLTWVIERRLILARTAGKLLRHALLAAMAATIAAGVWLLFEAMDSITVVVFIVAAGVLLTVLLRRAVLPVVLGVFYLAWTLGVLCVQTVRIPASITIDGDTIHVGRRRFELARLREISLTPPSYLPHARRFTLRTSRGRRLRWNLGTSEPGMISEAGFTDYAAFTAALTDAAARVSTRLVWDLD